MKHKILFLIVALFTTSAIASAQELEEDPIIVEVVEENGNNDPQ